MSRSTSLPPPIFKVPAPPHNIPKPLTQDPVVFPKIHNPEVYCLPRERFEDMHLDLLKDYARRFRIEVNTDALLREELAAILASKNEWVPVIPEHEKRFMQDGLHVYKTIPLAEEAGPSIRRGAMTAGATRDIFIPERLAAPDDDELIDGTSAAAAAEDSGSHDHAEEFEDIIFAFPPLGPIIGTNPDGTPRHAPPPPDWLATLQSELEARRTHLQAELQHAKASTNEALAAFVEFTSKFDEGKAKVAEIAKVVMRIAGPEAEKRIMESAKYAMENGKMPDIEEDEVEGGTREGVAPGPAAAAPPAPPAPPAPKKILREFPLSDFPLKRTDKGKHIAESRRSMHMPPPRHHIRPGPPPPPPPFGPAPRSGQRPPSERGPAALSNRRTQTHKLNGPEEKMLTHFRILSSRHWTKSHNTRDEYTAEVDEFTTFLRATLLEGLPEHVGHRLDQMHPPSVAYIPLPEAEAPTRKRTREQAEFVEGSSSNPILSSSTAAPPLHAPPAPSHPSFPQNRVSATPLAPPPAAPLPKHSSAFAFSRMVLPAADSSMALRSPRAVPAALAPPRRPPARQAPPPPAALAPHANAASSDADAEAGRPKKRLRLEDLLVPPINPPSHPTPTPRPGPSTRSTRSTQRGSMVLPPSPVQLARRAEEEAEDAERKAGDIRWWLDGPLENENVDMDMDLEYEDNSVEAELELESASEPESGMPVGLRRDGSNGSMEVDSDSGLDQLVRQAAEEVGRLSPSGMADSEDKAASSPDAVPTSGPTLRRSKRLRTARTQAPNTDSRDLMPPPPVPSAPSGSAPFSFSSFQAPRPGHRVLAPPPDRPRLAWAEAHDRLFSPPPIAGPSQTQGPPPPPPQSPPPPQGPTPPQSPPQPPRPTAPPSRPLQRDPRRIYIDPTSRAVSVEIMPSQASSPARDAATEEREISEMRVKAAEYEREEREREGPEGERWPLW